MFLFSLSQLQTKCSTDFSLITTTNNKAILVFAFAILEYTCTLLMLTFVFWGNYLLATDKTDLPVTPMAFIVKAVHNSKLQQIGLFFALVWGVGKFSEIMKKRKISQCEKLINENINIETYLQIKGGLFNNYESSNEIITKFKMVRKNLIDLLNIVDCGLAEFIVNVIACIVVIYMIRPLISNKPAFLFLLVSLLICTTVFILTNYVLYQQPNNFHGEYQNSIGQNRKFGLTETITSIFQKDYKFFEEYTVQIVYILFVGILIPLITMALNEDGQSEGIYLYLVILSFYLWKNSSQFHFLFEYYAKTAENKTIAQGCIPKLNHVNIKDCSLSLANFSIEKSNADFSNEIILKPKEINYFIGTAGKTTLIKKIFGLVDRDKSSVVTFENIEKKITIRNPEFGAIADSLIYINLNETYQMTIREFFLCENPKITEHEIFSLLAEVQVLHKLDKYKNVLEVNLLDLNSYERQMVYLAKIFMKNKSIFIGENIFQNLSAEQIEFIKNTIQNRFDLIILLQNNKENQNQNVYLIKKIQN